MLGSNQGQYTGYPDYDFSWFSSQSCQANARTVPQLCHTHFLPNPFQLIIIIYQSSYHLTVYSPNIKSVIKFSYLPSKIHGITSQKTLIFKIEYYDDTHHASAMRFQFSWFSLSPYNQVLAFYLFSPFQNPVTRPTP
jgi:hypothetical protein